MKRVLLSLFIVLFSAVPALAADLVVSAAASLTDAFNEIEPAFEKENPDVNLVMNYAASGALFAQIEQGAPADVFASANQKWMDKAADKSFILPDTRVTFAMNSLVISVPKDNPAKVASMDDLTADRVKSIGIGTPKTVPAGNYAKTALEKAGLYEKLSKKYIFGESVRQVLDYLVRGEVDCGFVYKTDAVKAGDPVAIVAEVPLDKPVSYPIAVLKQSAQQDVGKKFLAFIMSPAGQKILESKGFKSPK
jgi:molybdate transport system substrate-binding protein